MFFSYSVTDTRNREINVNVLAKCIRSGKVSRVMDPTGEWGIIKIEVFPALNQVDEYHCYKSKAKLPNGCNAHYGLVRTNNWVFHRQLFFHLSRACLGKIIVFHTLVRWKLN